MTSLVIQSYGKCLKTGVSKTGSAWSIHEAWYHSDDAPHPIRFEYFANDSNRPLGMGTFEVPLKTRFNGTRLEVEPDYNNARLVANKTALNPAQPKA